MTGLGNARTLFLMNLSQEPGTDENSPLSDSHLKMAPLDGEKETVSLSLI